MVDRERMAMTWRSGRNSRIVMGGTLAATLLLPLEWAVFAGVLLSILILLRITGKPDLTQLVQHPDYGFEEVPFNHAAPPPAITRACLALDALRPAWISRGGRRHPCPNHPSAMPGNPIRPRSSP